MSAFGGPTDGPFHPSVGPGVGGPPPGVPGPMANGPWSGGPGATGPGSWGPPTATNTIATVALVLAIVGLVVVLIPFVGAVSIFLGIAAIVCGAIGANRARLLGRRGVAITGCVLGVVALVLGVVNPIAWAIAFGDERRTVDVTLEVTSTSAPAANVTVSLDNFVSGPDRYQRDDESDQATLPYSSTYTDVLMTRHSALLGADDWSPLFTVSAHTPFTSAESLTAPLECRILVDGVEVSRESGSGSVSCSWLGENFP